MEREGALSSRSPRLLWERRWSTLPTPASLPTHSPTAWKAPDAAAWPILSPCSGPMSRAPSSSKPSLTATQLHAPRQLVAASHVTPRSTAACSGACELPGELAVESPSSSSVPELCSRARGLLSECVLGEGGWQEQRGLGKGPRGRIQSTLVL